MVVQINNIYDFYSSLVLLYNYDFIYRMFYGEYKYFIYFYIVLLFERISKILFSYSSFEISILLSSPQMKLNNLSKSSSLAENSCTSSLVN